MQPAYIQPRKTTRLELTMVGGQHYERGEEQRGGDVPVGALAGGGSLLGAGCCPPGTTAT
jgi:hypothetical protein